MQKKKTRFEQVPLKAAKSALRLQTSRPKTAANGSPLSGNPVPIRMGIRRFLRRRPYKYFRRGTIDFHREEKLRRREKSANPGKPS
jgi:hypothetical protein